MTHTSQISQAKTIDRAVVDWPTTMALTAVAICLTQVIHEGAHALTCSGVGAELQEFSALHVSCQSDTAWQSKIVSGSAAIANIIVGLVVFALLQRPRRRTAETQFFLWLFMLMNWLIGAGYWMFSGIANVGDWANVIEGWEPHWLWRLIMTIAGTGFYMLFVWLALQELGKIIGGEHTKEQIRRATKLGVLSYISVVVVILIAAIFNPYGMTGLPAIGALLLALGGMSPLLWMMQWFRAESFVKLPKAPLEIQRQWSWIVVAAVMVIGYAFILGRTVYF